MSTSQPRPFTIEDALGVKVFADRCPVRFSPDGRFIAYSLENRSGEEMREETWVVEVGSGHASQVLPEARTAWGPSWAPTGQRLAFYADTGEGLQLWLWDAETGEALRVSPAIIAADFRFEVPRWTPDGTAVVCKMAGPRRFAYYAPSGKPMAPEKLSALPLNNASTVRCWESPRSGAVDGESFVPDWGGWMWGAIARVDVATSEVLPLTQETQTRGWTVSPDGNHLAFMRFAGRERAGSANLVFDLCVVPSRGGGVRELVRRLHESYGIAFSWSPDCRALAYRPGREVAIVEVATGAQRVLTNFVHGDAGEWYSAPLWSADQAFLIVAEGGTVWRIPVDGAKAIDLAPDRGDSVIFGIVAPGAEPILWPPDGRSVVAGVHNRKTKEDGCARVDLTGRGMSQPAVAAQWLSAELQFYADVSPACNLFAFVREDGAHPSDIWLADADSLSRRRLTTLNSHITGIQFATPQLISWVGPDGDTSRGIFLPPLAPAVPPYPTVFVVYEGVRSQYRARFGIEHPQYDNLHVYAAHGYAVCVPDLVVSDEKPAASIRDMLARAVSAIVEAGLADPARIGIFGHSYGGYIVNVAITELDCFAAAVSAAGPFNLTSEYGTTRERYQGDGESEEDWVESGQGRMGVPPWENPERYVENSPLFRLHRVTAPVLIIAGAQEMIVGQSWELFCGLRRLGKTALIAIYEGEDHGYHDWTRANIIDRWNRVLAWFDKYLRPDAAP